MTKKILSSWKNLFLKRNISFQFFYQVAFPPRQNKRTNERMQMNEWTNEQMNERTNKRTNERTNANEWKGEFFCTESDFEIKVRI